MTFFSSDLLPEYRSRTDPQACFSWSQTGISADTAPCTSSLPTCSNTLVRPEPGSSMRWPPTLTLKPSSGTAMARPPSTGLRSVTRTRLPSVASSAPADRPATPAPITTTS
jgi:hypothetical protein